MARFRLSRLDVPRRAEQDNLAEIDWPVLMREAYDRWQITSLRPGQRELIELVLRGQSAVGILPTGHGKSLCFQLPALHLPKAVVVVSPLIALMQDQQAQATDAALDVAKLNSTLSRAEERATREDIHRGVAQLIYVTPERLEHPEYLELLRAGGVSLLVVDEAHCISQWGHDFRPAYLAIRHARRILGDPPVLALTATATPQVAEDVRSQLGIEDAPLVTSTIERPNIMLEVFRTVNGDAKRARVLELLAETDGVAILYVATVRAAEELQRWLSGHGIAAARYHGQLRAAERDEIYRNFMADQYRVIVATKAFGLGINKGDIRLVIHYHLTDSLESYYQEAGRAGRDGAPARATLLFRLEDRRIQTYFLGGKYPRAAQADQLYRALLQSRSSTQPPFTVTTLAEAAGLSLRRTKVLIAQLEAASIIARRGRRLEVVATFADADALDAYLDQYADRSAGDRSRLEAVMHYGQMTECRGRYLRQYFGEPADADCGHCDNCRDRDRRSPPARRRGRSRGRTAPTVPAVNGSSALPAAGDPVRHAAHGEGVVLSVAGNDGVVRFILGDTHTLPLAQLARSGIEPPVD